MSLLFAPFLEAKSNGSILTAMLPSSASSKAYDNSMGTPRLKKHTLKKNFVHSYSFIYLKGGGVSVSKVAEVLHHGGKGGGGGGDYKIIRFYQLS